MTSSHYKYKKILHASSVWVMYHTCKWSYISIKVREELLNKQFEMKLVEN